MLSMPTKNCHHKPCSVSSVCVCLCLRVCMCVCPRFFLYVVSALKDYREGLVCGLLISLNFSQLNVAWNSLTFDSKHHLLVQKSFSIPQFLFQSTLSGLLIFPCPAYELLSFSLLLSPPPSLSLSILVRLTLYLTSFLMDGGWLPLSHRQSGGNQ